jgi:hypothetical protein
LIFPAYTKGKHITTTMVTSTEQKGIKSSSANNQSAQRFVSRKTSKRCRNNKGGQCNYVEEGRL